MRVCAALPIWLWRFSRNPRGESTCQTSWNFTGEAACRNTGLGTPSQIEGRKLPKRVAALDADDAGRSIRNGFGYLLRLRFRPFPHSASVLAQRDACSYRRSWRHGTPIDRHRLALFAYTPGNFA